MTGSGSREFAFACTADHRTVVPLPSDAPVPEEWICSLCGLPAVRRDGPSTERTPYDFLRMRRTLEDGERLLDDALAQLRRRRWSRGSS
ncbi:MAG: hypothetical protein QOJ03_1219 [Frankiaceae bacterium]|jgi:hypothetical protein|nr:hypothetical protein [Frankiaceae bacterium]